MYLDGLGYVINRYDLVHFRIDQAENNLVHYTQSAGFRVGRTVLQFPHNYYFLSFLAKGRVYL